MPVGRLLLGKCRMPFQDPAVGPDARTLHALQRGPCLLDQRIILAPEQLRGLDHRSEEHTSELQSRGHLVCRLLLEKKKKKIKTRNTRTTESHQKKLGTIK